jgi:hypothetical protein
MREVSDVIHSCVVDALHYPPDKRAHRFFPLEPSEFFYPPGRSERYTIIEIRMFEGRTVEAKKALIRLLFERFAAMLGIGLRTLRSPFSRRRCTIGVFAACRATSTLSTTK